MQFFYRWKYKKSKSYNGNSELLCNKLPSSSLFGIHSHYTVSKWKEKYIKEGILKANRTQTDRRYYTYEQYLQFKGLNSKNDNRSTVIYVRVSTKNQKDDLMN